MDLPKEEKIIKDTHVDFEKFFGGLRRNLSEWDINEYRKLGKDCGMIVGDVAKLLAPGMSECEVAGMLAERCLRKSIDAVVLLVAADERIQECRHPLPTKKCISSSVMLVICGRRNGLIASLTRMVMFGNEVPVELKRKHEAATYIDAVAIKCTNEGAKGSDILQKIVEAYKHFEFPEEWKLHHQGGCAGYRGREWFASMDSTVTFKHYAKFIY